MKKIFIYTLLATLTFGCSDYLDEEVVSGITDKYYTTPYGFEDAVKASYEPLRSFYGTERGMSLTVFGTDTYRMGSDGSWKFLNQYSAQLDARTGLVNEIWNSFYIGINAANTVVSRAGNVSGMEEALVTERVAEAKFLRAHYYFILAQMFGDVHLTLEETTEVETSATRTPVSQVYDAIIADLEFAVEHLDVAPKDYGRASKAAAQHLLARVHLTRATGTLLGNTNAGGTKADYQKAADYAQNVINDYDFHLLDNFSDVFDIENQVNPEVVWSVQYTNDKLTNGGGNNAHLYFLMEYDALPGMKRTLEYGRPWKRFRPTDFTLDVLFADRENDSRYDASFQNVFYVNNPTGDLAAGDTSVYLPGYDVSDELIASKPYLLIPPRNYTPKLYPTLIKFLDPTRSDVGAVEGTRDFLAFRLAEDYLIAAEALMLDGKAADAVPLINTLRERAAYPGKEAEMDISEAALSEDFILNERGRELLGEQFRWFDLVRTGTLVERVKAHNPDAVDNIKPFHALRPIPQDQIDRTSTPFPQNDGY